MGKLVKYADDMIAKFTGKTAPDRVGTRYEASKSIAIPKYASNGLKYRILIERARTLLTANNVPTGLWGVHLGFVLNLARHAEAYAGKMPAALVEGLKSEYALKGADPAIMDILAKLVTG